MSLEIFPLKFQMLKINIYNIKKKTTKNVFNNNCGNFFKLFCNYLLINNKVLIYNI